MKMNRLFIVVLFAVAGCTSSSGVRQSDVDDLRAQVYQLDSRIQALEESNQRLHADMESLRVSNAEHMRNVDEEVSAVKKRVDASESARNRMKDHIISDLSKKMANVISKQVPGSAGEVGRYHVVEKGDTLSAIATAYHANVDAIVKANGLKNANAIRVGQKLFIPE